MATQIAITGASSQGAGKRWGQTAFISMVRLPVPFACLTVNTYYQCNSSPTASFRRLRCYDVQLPTPFFLCARTILLEHSAFFLVL